MVYLTNTYIVLLRCQGLHLTQTSSFNSHCSPIRVHIPVLQMGKQRHTERKLLGQLLANGELVFGPRRSGFAACAHHWYMTPTIPAARGTMGPIELINSFLENVSTSH